MKKLILTSLLAMGAWMYCSEKSFAQYVTYTYSYPSPYAPFGPIQVVPTGVPMMYPYSGPMTSAYGGSMITPSPYPWITYSPRSYSTPRYYLAYSPGFGYRRVYYP